MLRIRQARPTDIDEIVAIEEANFSPEEAAPKLILEKRIAVRPETFLIAEMDYQVAGYIEGQVIETSEWTDEVFVESMPNPSTGGYIAVTSLSISQNYQGQGLGTALIAALKDLAVAQERQGIILTCHDYLISYYELNGFTEQGLSVSSLGGGIWYEMLWQYSQAS